MGRRPDSALGNCKIVIEMLIAGTMNKQITRHFQACERLYSVFRTKIRQMGSVENRYQVDRQRKTTRREGIYNVTSFRSNRFLSRSSIPGLVKNAIFTKTVQRRLKGARLR